MNEIEQKKLDIFRTVVLGIIDQGCPSYDKHSCKYRIFREDLPPLKCGAGWLITDENYRPEFDANNSDANTALPQCIENINYLKESHLAAKYLLEKYGKEVYPLMRDCQAAHDANVIHSNPKDDLFLRYWAKDMHRIMVRYDIRDTEIERKLYSLINSVAVGLGETSGKEA